MSFSNIISRVRSRKKPPAPKNIIYFGDSITHGALASDYLTTANLTFAKIVATYFGATFTNNGRDGTSARTHTSGVPYNGNHLEDIYTLANTGNYNSGQYLVVTYGANMEELSAAQWVADIKYCLNLLHGLGWQYNQMVIGTPPYYYNRVTDYGPYTAMPPKVAAVMDLADKLGCYKANHWDYMQPFDVSGSLLNGDLLHPNDAGHAKMAECLKNVWL